MLKTALNVLRFSAHPSRFRVIAKKIMARVAEAPVQDTREETFELTGVWQSQGCSAPTQGQVGRRIAMAKAAFQAVALRKLR